MLWWRDRRSGKFRQQAPSDIVFNLVLSEQMRLLRMVLRLQARRRDDGFDRISALMRFYNTLHLCQCKNLEKEQSNLRKKMTYLLLMFR